MTWFWVSAGVSHSDNLRLPERGDPTDSDCEWNRVLVYRISHLYHTLTYLTTPTCTTPSTNIYATHSHIPTCTHTQFTTPAFGHIFSTGTWSLHALPLTYITFEVESTDQEAHHVQIYFDMTAQVGVVSTVPCDLIDKSPL